MNPAHGGAHWMLHLCKGPVTTLESFTVTNGAQPQGAESVGTVLWAYA